MKCSCDVFLPSDIPTSHVRLRVGLISDTHMPERCETLPATIFQIFAGTDLILHAGDVGELWVLDRLSTIAPVIAVHGNDDTVESKRELANKQLLHISGRRLLLFHSHYEDREMEQKARSTDEWLPKLDERANIAHSAHADLAVFGHTHVPMDCEYDCVRFINPGAISSSNFISRQARKTIALLFIDRDQRFHPVHIDIANPYRSFKPIIDWAAGFRVAYNSYSHSILSPALLEDWPRVSSECENIASDVFRQAVLRVARRCWSEQQDSISHNDLIMALQTDESITESIRNRMATILLKGQI